MRNEGFFCYFSVNPCMSVRRRLLKLKRKNSFKIIIGFFFTPPLFLATKVAISFVYCSPKTIKCTQKPKIEKKFRGIDKSSERASEWVRFPTSYLQLALAHERNSRVKKRLCLIRLNLLTNLLLSYDMCLDWYVSDMFSNASAITLGSLHDATLQAKLIIFYLPCGWRPSLNICS